MIQPGMTRRKRSEHYVNNKEFLAALVEYRTQVEVAYRKKFGQILSEQDEIRKSKKMGYETTNPSLHWGVFFKDC